MMSPPAIRKAISRIFYLYFLVFHHVASFAQDTEMVAINTPVLLASKIYAYYIEPNEVWDVKKTIINLSESSKFHPETVLQNNSALGSYTIPVSQASREMGVESVAIRYKQESHFIVDIKFSPNARCFWYSELMEITRPVRWRASIPILHGAPDINARRFSVAKRISESSNLNASMHFRHDTNACIEHLHFRIEPGTHPYAL